MDDESKFYWQEVQPDLQKDVHEDVLGSNGLAIPHDLDKIRGDRWRFGRNRLKFSLSMGDEDDSWLFAKPYSALSLGGCFVENDAPMDEEKVDDSSVCGGVDEIVDSLVNDEVAEDGNEEEDFNSIPIVDMSLPLEGPDGHAAQIAAACRTSGFFYITNHGVDAKLMASVMECSRNFFDLDLRHKLKAGQDGGSSGYRGYFGIGMEDLENKDGTRDLAKEEGTKKSKGDQKEGFDCGLESVEGYHENVMSKKAYIDFFGDNSWPDETNHESIVGFRHTLVEYQKALLKLSDELMIALAVSLSTDNVQVPIDYFIAQSRNPMCTLRLLHYPPAFKKQKDQSTELLKSSTGCGAHTDYGLFTILQQDEIGGLQIRNKSNAWIDAPPLPGTFVINVGDMLSWWTKGEYASTVHRVISPSLMELGDESGKPDDTESRGAGKHRYSIPFFFNPDYNAIIKPIRDVAVTTNGSGDGKTAIEILKERYAGTFKSK